MVSRKKTGYGEQAKFFDDMNVASKAQPHLTKYYCLIFDLCHWVSWLSLTSTPRKIDKMYTTSELQNYGTQMATTWKTFSQQAAQSQSCVVRSGLLLPASCFVYVI